MRREGENMWNSVKSVKLSTVFTKIVIVLVMAFAVALPFIMKQTELIDRFMISTDELNYILPIIYLCCAIALIALWNLNRLLVNIKNELVFVEKNVRILRAISWCCLLAAVVLIFGSFFSLVFLLLSVMAGFVGLILRIVKNVFEAAVDLKNENDYTI